MSMWPSFKRQNVVPAALMLLAGLVAYFAYAAGGDGPMGYGGREDADDNARDAWVQLPLHAALAIALAVGGPSGLRWLAWFIGVLGSGLVFVWAVVLTIAVAMRSATVHFDLGNVAICAWLVVLYWAALRLAFDDDVRQVVAD